MSTNNTGSLLLSDITLNNIDLINQDTNLFHRTGTGTFWIDSLDGNIKIMCILQNPATKSLSCPIGTKFNSSKKDCISCPINYKFDSKIKLSKIKIN